LGSGQPTPIPQWHYEQIDESLRRAAAHLPRVDAMAERGGVYVDSEVRVACSSAPSRELFDRRVRGLFGELRRAWNGIPFVVVNDGEVTALAGRCSPAVRDARVGDGLERGGRVRDARRRLTSRLDERRSCPSTTRRMLLPTSGPRSRLRRPVPLQQAAGRLLAPAGIETEPGISLPERSWCQELNGRRRRRAARVYQTIGTTRLCLLEYRQLCDYGHLLLLGG